MLAILLKVGFPIPLLDADEAQAAARTLGLEVASGSKSGRARRNGVRL